jgi:hypothetical protein
MVNVEIRFIIDGREVSLDSFAETIVREVRASVHDEFEKNLARRENLNNRHLHRLTSETRQAVSVRETARFAELFSSDGGQIYRAEGHPHSQGRTAGLDSHEKCE